jgi:hypothetical protein
VGSTTSGTSVLTAASDVAVRSRAARTEVVKPLGAATIADG